jgi:hypothetical protein
MIRLFLGGAQIYACVSLIFLIISHPQNMNETWFLMVAVTGISGIVFVNDWAGK